MVEALVNARADVNSSVADAPLLVAIRARHTAAVSALCAQGAKVALGKVGVVAHGIVAMSGFSFGVLAFSFCLVLPLAGNSAVPEFQAFARTRCCSGACSGRSK